MVNICSILQDLLNIGRNEKIVIEGWLEGNWGSEPNWFLERGQ